MPLIARLFLHMVLLLGCVACDAGKTTAYPLHDGRMVEPSAWQGKWVYINYWAEWCKPCIEEIPELDHFQQQHQDVMVLGVNFDGIGGEQLSTMVQKMQIGFAVVSGTWVQQVFKHPAPQVLPATFVFGPDGKLVTTLVGPQTRATLLQARQGK